jgi:hypothetical protein
VIAFASCVASPEIFRNRCLPGMQRVAEDDFLFGELTTKTSIFEAYNEALDHFCGVDDLEALVLLHQDTELLDRRFCATVREAMSDPEVALVGAIGARDVRSLAWWDGTMAGRVIDSRAPLDFGFENPRVDSVDGLLMILSPWAVRSLRFDADTYTGFHAYDVDFGFTVKAAGRTAVVADLGVMHHTLEGDDPDYSGFGDKAAWLAADATFRAKWGLSAERLPVAA